VERERGVSCTLRRGSGADRWNAMSISRLRSSCDSLSGAVATFLRPSVTVSPNVGATSRFGAVDSGDSDTTMSMEDWPGVIGTVTSPTPAPDSVADPGSLRELSDGRDARRGP